MTDRFERYRREWFADGAGVRADVLAGIVVALALIPEAIGFAIMAGVDPRVGLYASVAIAIVISLIGGRPGMISAATAAVAVVVVPLVREHGVGLSGFPCVAGHNGQQGVPLCHDAKNLPYRMSFSISFWRAALPVPPSSRAVCSIR